MQGFPCVGDITPPPHTTCQGGVYYGKFTKECRADRYMAFPLQRNRLPCPQYFCAVIYTVSGAKNLPDLPPTKDPPMLKPLTPAKTQPAPTTPRRASIRHHRHQKKSNPGRKQQNPPQVGSLLRFGVEEGHSKIN